jgi:hypothetical protein
MTNPGQESDAAFFSLMHHFLAASNKSDAGVARENSYENRRSQARRSFSIPEWIAPGYCWEVPPASAWIEVQCHDLTPRGFSFLFDKKPDFERLVVRFRSADPICVAARVNYFRPVAADDQGNVVEGCLPPAGAFSNSRKMESLYLVGCEFLRRFAT